MPPSSGETCTSRPRELQLTDYLSMFVVDAEWDGGRVQEEPRLLLIHLLPQTLHASLTLRCFLDIQKQDLTNLS